MHRTITTPYDPLAAHLCRRLLGHTLAPRHVELDAVEVDGVWWVPSDDMPPPAAPAAMPARLAA